MKIRWDENAPGYMGKSPFDRKNDKEKYYDAMGNEIEERKIEYTVEHVRAHGNRHDL